MRAITPRGYRRPSSRFGRAVAPTIVGVGSTTGTYVVAGTTSSAAAFNASTAAGDLIIGAVACLSQSDTITTPDGWSLLAGPLDSHAANPVRLYVFSKVATGSDGFNWTKVGTAGAWRHVTLTARGATTVNASASNQSSANTEPVLATITPTKANSFIVGVATHRVSSGAQASAPTGYTERVDTGSANVPNFVINTITQTGPGTATGAVNVDISGSGSGWATHHFAI